MIIRNFYEDKLSQASYLIGCAATSVAIVVDPSRDIQQYTECAELLGLKIVAVTETHIHADFLSGTRELGAATGACIYLSDEGDSDWKYQFADPAVTLVRDGDLIRIGNLSLKVIHTPGHTPEHIAFLLTDHPTSEIPHSLLAGDFLFVGDVGRPDLLELAANMQGTMEKGARTLFRSLGKLNDLPDSLLIWPGHGAGSACGKSLGGSPVSSLGYERRTNWALNARNEDSFVNEILSGQPEPPLYFKEMKRLNKLGPTVLHGLPTVKRVTTASGQIVDIRSPQSIKASSYRDAVAIPYGKSFTGWAGWVIRYGEPITLISENQERADRAARDLATIGLDSVAAWIVPSSLDPGRFAAVNSASSVNLDTSALILDVRGLGERRLSHIPGSIHIPFGHLQDRLEELPRDRKIVVHCASGARSLVAYSILIRAGFKDVHDLAGGISAIQQESPALVCSGAV